MYKAVKSVEEVERSTNDVLENIAGQQSFSKGI